MFALLPGILILLGGCYQSPWPDPVEHLDSYDGPSFAELLEIEAWGDRVAFCSGVQGLNLYDASEPERMVFLDRAMFSGGSGRYPRCQRLTIDADAELIYVANHGDEIQPIPFIAVVDASVPELLVELHSEDLDASVEGLALHGDYLLAAAHGEGLIVFDRSDRGALTERARLPLGNAWHVKVHGRTAYVADGAAGLSVVDLSDPEAPALVGVVELPGTAKDLEIADERLFVALGSAGVALLSIAEPAAPELIEIEHTSGSALALAWGAGPEALYVAAWNDIRIFDASDPADLVLRGHEPLPIGRDVDSRILGIAARDDLIFSSAWTEMTSYRYDPELSAPDLVVSPDRLVLPRTEAGEAVEAPLFVNNIGSEILAFRGIRHGSAALKTEDVPEELAPGESAVIRVRFTPTGNSSFRSRITLKTDDPDQTELEVPVQSNNAGVGVGDHVVEELGGSVTFTGLNGSPLRLSDLEGRVVLLAYFATF